MEQTTSQESPLQESLRLGIAGARTNLWPGMVLWFFGLVLVVSYYQAPVVSSLFDQVGRFKDEFAPWFAILSTALFGSLIPWLAQALFLPQSKRQPFRQVPPLFLFWGIHGWQVDGLYRLQSHLFGTGIDPLTIVLKTFVDQFVWVPFLAVPQVLLSYLLIEHELSLAKFRIALARKGYLRRAIPLIIANWVVWIPSVALVYLFPLPLQLPLQNIILALWCLIISFFAKNA